MEEEIEHKVAQAQIDQISYIYDSLRQGAAKKGGFSMEDILKLKNAKDRLMSLFTENEEGTFSSSKSEDFEALEMLITGVQLLQNTGVFVFDGSIELLKTLNGLKTALDECADPSLKLTQMKKKLADTRQSSNQKPSNRGGKGRGQNNGSTKI